MKRSEIRGSLPRIPRSLSSGGAARRPVGSMRATSPCPHLDKSRLPPYLSSMDFIRRNISIDPATDARLREVAGTL